MCRRWRAMTSSCRTSNWRAPKRRRKTIEKNLGRGVSKGVVTQVDADAALARITPHHRQRRLCCGRSGHRGSDRERRREGEDLRRPFRPSEARSAARHQHLVDLDHPAGGDDRPARPLHRPAFLQPRPADDARRDHPRPRHLACDQGSDARLRRDASARPPSKPPTARPSSSTASSARCSTKRSLRWATASAASPTSTPA